jgi:mxaA protein
MRIFNHLFARSLLLCSLAISFTPQSAMAIDSQDLPDVKPGNVSIKTIEPVKLVGYTVGDVIEREVILTIKTPYKLVETSLPITGYEKRYKGQLIGIELKSISHTKDENDESTTHHIKLAYQVFTNNIVAKNASLGPEYINLVNTKNKQDVVKYRIPSLDIAISPIAIFGQVKIENNMSQLLGPLFLSSEKEKNQLKASIVVLAISLLGLLYIVGMRAWLPLMGGNFAKAYRALRKLPHSHEGLQQAVSKVHESLNSTATFSVFSNNLDSFIAKKPNFAPVKTEIQQFFGLSRQVYFEPNAKHDLDTDPHQWLQQFARRCRDCERGLTPAPLNQHSGK